MTTEEFFQLVRKHGDDISYSEFAQGITAVKEEIERLRNDLHAAQLLCELQGEKLEVAEADTKRLDAVVLGLRMEDWGDSEVLTALFEATDDDLDPRMAIDTALAKIGGRG